MKTKTLLLIFLISSSSLFSQKVSKGFEYINTDEYSKALSIFNKAVDKNKDYVAAQYGLAQIYSNPDYARANNFRAYRHVTSAKNRFLDISQKDKNAYKQKYNITIDVINYLQEEIIQTEYDKAMAVNDLSTWNAFIDSYRGTKQSDALLKHRDKVVFEDVKTDGSLFALEKFIADYPYSDYIQQAKELKELKWKAEYNRIFRSIELSSIQEFYDMYPGFPYYDDSTQIYFELAKYAASLNLHMGYLNSTLPYYSDFIKEVAPHEMAFQALMCLIQPQIENNNIQAAIDTVKNYKQFFIGYYKVDSLISILSRPQSNITSKSVGSVINSDAYEYMPVVTADDQIMYFCGQDRPDNKGGEDIYVSKFSDDDWSQPYLIDNLCTSFGNEAPLAISADGTQMIVFSNGNVYLSDKTNSGWSRLRPINEINTNKYWEADAYFSPDGNAIFFASDRPSNIGGFHKFSSFYHGDYVGNLDIYIIEKQDDGSWSQPINLGTTINTPYAERTPFLHPDMKTLYFASDGHPGVGKMDVFKCTRLSDTSWTQWSEPVNLGLGINTPKKEYGYKISTNGEIAYFSKFFDNKSDIHYIYLPEATRPDKVAIVKGVVTDKDGNKLQANLIWENLVDNLQLGELKTDPVSGEYIITLPLGKNYGFYVSKAGYYPISENLDLTNFDENVTVVKNFQLVDEQQIIQGQTAIQLNNVFFDFDKYDLKSTSYAELDRLADFIKQHPDLKIEISGHTDNKGSDNYNNQLSQNRANSVRDYLISKGCNQNQLISKGYGSFKPIADNSTDAGRQQNRRVEFMVIQ